MGTTSPTSPLRWRVIINGNDGRSLVVARLAHEWDALAMARRYWNYDGVRIEPRWDASLVQKRHKGG